jgi:hypothetical protein
MNFYGVSATGYLASRFYLVGGLGVAEVVAVDGDNLEQASTDSKLAFMAGLGVEAYQSSSFALSIEARVIGASFDEGDATGANLMLGFQWF